MIQTSIAATISSTPEGCSEPRHVRVTLWVFGICDADADPQGRHLRRVCTLRTGQTNMLQGTWLTARPIRSSNSFTFPKTTFNCTGCLANTPADLRQQTMVASVTKATFLPEDRWLWMRITSRQPLHSNASASHIVCGMLQTSYLTCYKPWRISVSDASQVHTDTPQAHEHCSPLNLPTAKCSKKHPRGIKTI